MVALVPRFTTLYLLDRRAVAVRRRSGGRRSWPKVVSVAAVADPASLTLGTFPRRERAAAPRDDPVVLLVACNAQSRNVNRVHCVAISLAYPRRSRHVNDFNIGRGVTPIRSTTRRRTTRSHHDKQLYADDDQRREVPPPTALVRSRDRRKPDTCWTDGHTNVDSFRMANIAGSS
jgi:hypothetical protein